MKNKFFVISIIILVMGAGTLAIILAQQHNYNDTKRQLKYLYEIELDNCLITKTTIRKFDGRGNYKLFKTECNSEYLPILFRDMNSQTKDLFVEGKKVYKKANDFKLKLTDSEGNNYQFNSIQLNLMIGEMIGYLSLLEVA